MIKRMKRLILALSFVLALSGCGGGEKEEKGKEIAGILPTRIEQIGQGGVIPEGHEAKVEAQSEYTLDMLWGTWVRKGSSASDPEVPEQTIQIGTEEEPKEIECFPKMMSFNPAWADAYTGYGSGRAVAESNCMNAENDLRLSWDGTRGGSGFAVTYDVKEPLGEALEQSGYGFGVAVLNEVFAEDDYAQFFSGLTPEIKIAYAIHENLLAIGVTEEGAYDDELSETSIVEIDYEMSLKGYELELTYNGETAVYVPEQIEGTTNYQGFYMKKAGVTDGYEEIDKIIGISLIPDAEYLQINEGSSTMMFNLHEGYVESSYEFGEDGIVTINSSKGDTYEYEYYYSGDSLTLISDNQTAVYSLYDYVIESQNETPTYGFYAAENEINVRTYWSVSDLLEKGFRTFADLSQPVASCQVTDKITLSYQGAELEIEAVNPYENVVALADCMIGLYSIKDTSGIISKMDGTEIGISTLDEIDLFYAPYEKTDSILRYKGESPGILEIRSFDAAYGNSTTGAKVLEEGDNMEVIYHFENNVLEEITIENPALLYNGLQDNVENSLLAQMEPAEFQGVLQVRDTIMDRLRSAFAEAGIEVNINEKTGEILMDNDILFAVDKYNLTAEGQQYIDSFMGVYASVITAEEFSDYISGVYFEGHTDSSGSYGYNLILSQNRAETVLDYCVNSTGSDMNSSQKAKLQQLATAIGYSSSDLVYDDRGNEDMDASRRVAIKFFINVEGTGVTLPTGQDDTATQTQPVITMEETTSEEPVTEEPKESSATGLELDDYYAFMGDSSILLMEEDGGTPFVWILPMDVEMFSSEGWIPDDGLDALIEPGYRMCTFRKGNAVITAIVCNDTSSAVPLSECEVCSVLVTSDMGVYLGLKGKIDLESTATEIMDVYGTPDYYTTDSGNVFLTYVRDGDTSIHFANGSVNGIFVIAPGYSYDSENIFYESIMEEN